MKENGRIFYLDVIRVCACLMIVLMHSPFKDVDHSPIVASSISYFTSPSIGLFFMVSGALLLQNKLPTKVFLRRRFTKIILPTLIFSLIGIINAYFFKGTISDALLPKMLMSIPFAAQGGYGTLWFMYTIAGLYLLTPILSRWIRTATSREIGFYLALWAITLTYSIIDDFLIVDASPNGLLFHFQGAVGYFVLGYFLHHRVDVHRPLLKWLLIIATFVCLAVPVICKLTARDIDFYEYFWYFSPTCALMAFLWFVLAKRTLSSVTTIGRFSRLVVITSNLSFGIYLVHIFVMRDFLRRIDFLHQTSSPVQIIVTTLSTFIISWIICYLISKTKISKYIIGY